MSNVQDVINLAKDTLNQTMDLIKRLPLLLIVPTFHFTIYFIFVSLGMYRLGMLSGLIMGAVLGVVIASYLYVMRMAIYYKQFKFRYLYEGVRNLFIKSWFFVIVMNITLYLMALIGGSYIFGSYITLIPFIIFNPMPEIIYISEYNEREMFFYNFNFIKKNYIPWFSINLLLLIGLFIALALSSLMPFISNVILILYFGFVMIFRGYLFKKLHYTNFRKRKFETFKN